MATHPATGMPALDDDASGYAAVDDGAAPQTDSRVPLYVAGFVAFLLILWAIDHYILKRRRRRSVPERPGTPPGAVLDRMTLAALPNDVDTDPDPGAISDSLGLRLIDESKAD